MTSFANAMEYMKKKNRGAGGFKQFFTFQIYPLDRHGLRKQLRSWVQIPPSSSLSIWLITALNRACFGELSTVSAARIGEGSKLYLIASRKIKVDIACLP